MLSNGSQKILAEEFLKLHHSEKILLLPNAWDVISAKIYEQEGFKAIGTTSAGIAATLGYPDGQVMSLEENLSVVKRIVEKINLPVSVDIESGYSDSVEAVAGSAKSVLEVGAVGVNLEDGTGKPDKPLFDVSEQVEKIIAIREMTEFYAVHLFINARIDVYLVSTESQIKRFANAVARANVYLEAGADCVFIPDMGDLLQISTLSPRLRSFSFSCT